jgi:Flp pilus assembly protein TadG
MRRPRRPRHSAPGDCGSAAAELVLITPFFVALIGAFVIGAQLLLDRLQVEGVSRAAVQAAVLGPTPGAAGYSAVVTGVANVLGDGLECRRLAISTNTTHDVPGGQVFVTVSCAAPLAGLGLVGSQDAVVVQATSGAPVEPYREMGP